VEFFGQNSIFRSIATTAPAALKSGVILTAWIASCKHARDATDHCILAAASSKA
jgi:hypothetical protein